MPERLQCLAQGFSAAAMAVVGAPEVEQPVTAAKIENNKIIFIAA